MIGDSSLSERQRRSFDDQQNELAGRETGRMARFGVGIARELELKEKERGERAYLDALHRLLMTDLEYRKLYEELGARLTDAELEADTVIAAITEKLQQIDDDIADMETRTARGPDGQPVFRYADGTVVNANGEELPPEIADGIIWPPGAPRVEDYFDTKHRRDALADELEAWILYRNDVLGGTRNRYDDRDNPMNKDELRDALEEIEQARPSLQSLEAPAPSEIPSDPSRLLEMTLPTSLR